MLVVSQLLYALLNKSYPSLTIYFLMTGILIGVLLTVHIITCILLILIVLMQQPRSEGLGTTFGGNVTNTLFGSGAGNVLTKITSWLGIVFFITTISLAYLYSHRELSSGTLGSKLRNMTPPPVTTSAPPVQPPSTPATGSEPTKKQDPATATKKSPSETPPSHH